MPSVVKIVQRFYKNMDALREEMGIPTPAKEDIEPLAHPESMLKLMASVGEILQQQPLDVIVMTKAQLAVLRERFDVDTTNDEMIVLGVPIETFDTEEHCKARMLKLHKQGLRAKLF